MQTISLNSLSYLISIIINLGLGLWVFIRAPKNKINRYFFIFIVGVTAWLVSLFAYYNVASAGWIVVVGRFNFAIATLVVSIALEFVFVFPEENFAVKKWIHYVIATETIILFLITLLTPLVDQNEIISGSSRITSYGVLYPLSIIHFIVVTAAVIWILIKKAKISSKEDKARIYYVIFGLLLTSVFGLFTNVIMPSLGYQDVADLGSFSTLFLLFAFSYAIIKHHLFNVKIIITELLTFTLWIILLMNTFFSFGSQDFLLDVIILISVVVVGFFLIKSVIKEVTQREQIAKMAERLQKAYVIEKKAKEQIDKAYGIEKKANEELEQLGKYKDDFLRQAEHDLKTPLTVIIGYADLLLHGMYGKLPKKAIEMVKKIETVTENKVKDISNFLDIEQFKMGKGIVALKPGVELAPILEEIETVLGPKAKLKGIYLTLEMPEKIYTISADREKLKAALFNIIDNAVKYTIKGGVDIKIQNGAPLKIIIADTGIGIPEDKIKKIFLEQFERTDQAKKTAPGTGIGLALSAQIIALHNGKAWAESEGEGRGSIFYIELPVSH